jgi:hypothetical protein
MLSVWDISGQSNGTPIFSIDLGKIADYDGVGSDGERGSVYALGVGELHFSIVRTELISQIPLVRCLQLELPRESFGSGIREQVLRVLESSSGITTVSGVSC